MMALELMNHDEVLTELLARGCPLWAVVCFATRGSKPSKVTAKKLLRYYRHYERIDITMTVTVGRKRKIHLPFEKPGHKLKLRLHLPDH